MLLYIESHFIFVDTIFMFLNFNGLYIDSIMVLLHCPKNLGLTEIYLMSISHSMLCHY